MTEGTQTQQFPCPDPALRRLDRWKTGGHLRTWTRSLSEARRRSGGCQGLLPRAARHHGLYGTAAQSLELISYDPESGTFPQRLATSALSRAVSVGGRGHT